MIGGNQTDDHVKTGCFSRPVGPQETNNLTCVDAHADALYDVSAAIAFDESSQALLPSTRLSTEFSGF